MTITDTELDEMEKHSHWINQGDALRLIATLREAREALTEFLAYEPPDHAPQEVWDMARKALGSQPEDTP